jgi:hypothetical protein
MPKFLGLLDTEIDWVAYMQQVETFLSGDLNYYHYTVSISNFYAKFRVTQVHVYTEVAIYMCSRFSIN